MINDPHRGDMLTKDLTSLMCESIDSGTGQVSQTNFSYETGRFDFKGKLDTLILGFSWEDTMEEAETPSAPLSADEEWTVIDL